MTAKTQKTKANINRWDYLKGFCMAKDIIKKPKRETYEMGENICKPYNRKWLMSKICKKFI